MPLIDLTSIAIICVRDVARDYLAKFELVTFVNSNMKNSLGKLQVSKLFHCLT